MKKLLILAAFLTMLAIPAGATDFSLYGTYWDTDAAGDTLGGGLSVAFPLGNSGLALELRGAYLGELEQDPFEVVDDPDDIDDVELFVDNGLEVAPLEIGLRYTFDTAGGIDPYIAGGGGYYLLDTDVGNIDDEFGFYGAAGLVIGDGVGPDFFVEINFRKIEGSVAIDPDGLDDIDDLDFINTVDVDLDGPGANIGIIWRF